MPNLRLLAEGYFHQDYDLDYGDPDSVVIGFAEGECGAAARELTLEIDTLLASPMTEAQFGALWIETFLASYDPTRHGLTYRAWFAHVRGLLSTPSVADETALGRSDDPLGPTVDDD